MSYRFWESIRWLNSALCCRYTVVQFGMLQLPMRIDGVRVTAEWHWALGLFTDGQFQVLGAWRDEGPDTGQRIAADLHNRGLERVSALAADESVVTAMKAQRPQFCERSVAELVASGSASSRMRQAIRWTDTAAQHLQGRLSRAAKRHGPFADHAGAGDFLAQAFQRADKDLLADYWYRAKPAPYGLSAAPRVLARAA
ncbi:transposase [Roseateles sp. DC23W]|uniref:Transposase n=1 Tax=Pelomonas dachongensis TaxID=3299029 RepID=A0ABW7ETW3_9BURK